MAEASPDSDASSLAESIPGFGERSGLSSRLRWLELALVVVALIWIVLRYWRLVELAWPFTADDAYITLRYSRHLAEGAGLLWNVGEPPVEGYSNFTYVVLGAAALKGGFDPVMTLKMVGALMGVVAMLASFGLARFFVRPLPALLAPMLLSAHPGVVWWAVSGLETPSYMALAALAAYACFRGLGYRHADPQLAAAWTTSVGRYRRNWLSVAGLVAAVAAMTRPEGAVIFICLSAAFGFDALRRRRAGETDLRRRFVRAGLALLLPFALLFGGYFLLRWAYYGRFWPNTVYCKGSYDGSSAFYQHRKWWADASTLIVLALIVPVRRIDARWAVLWGLPLLYAGLLIGVDPIVSIYDRHFLCAHLYVCVAASIALGHLVTFMFEGRGPQLRGLLVVALVLLYQGRLGRQVAAAMASHLESYPLRMANREDLGNWLDARMGPEESFVIGDAGVVPYLARARVLDAYCLNAGPMTRPPIDRDTEAWADHILRAQPERIVVHSSSATALKPRPEYDFFPVLVDDPRFVAEYEEEKVFPDSRYSYFVFARKDPEVIEAEAAAEAARIEAEAAKAAKAEKKREAKRAAAKSKAALDPKGGSAEAGRANPKLTPALLRRDADSASAKGRVNPDTGEDAGAPQPQ